MEHDPKVPPYETSDQLSFAYISARDRWPIILTSAIDDVHKAVADCTDEAKAKEGKTIIEALAKLKYELQHDRELTPLPDDGLPDVPSYNAELSARSPTTWFSVSWLFAECYLYRRLHTLFSRSQSWRNHDVFAKQKISTFASGRASILELAKRYRELTIAEQNSNAVMLDASKSPEEQKSEAQKLLFHELTMVCLWGNATDLSLLTSLTYEDIQKLQASRAKEESEKNVLVNHTEAAFEMLDAARRSNPTKERKIDIVLDNAGFELFVDLILAGYLLSSGLATRVTLHPKSMPWFVSDVTPPDFASLLNALAEPDEFFSKHKDSKQAETHHEPLNEEQREDVSFMFNHWAGLHGEGKLGLRGNGFWTTQGSFWRIPTQEQALWEDLKESELVIFKGDLNYRKLTGDVMWSPATPFVQALGPLGAKSGARTLALRTCKADVVVGLPEGKDEEIRASEKDKSGARKWTWSGKYAVVQFHDGKKQID